jgi:hypothetical protein
VILSKSSSVCSITIGSFLANPYKAISLGERNIISSAILHAVDEKLPVSQLALRSLGMGGFGTVV